MKIDYSRDCITIEAEDLPIGKHEFVCGRLVRITKVEEVGPGPFNLTVYRIIEVDTDIQRED